MHVNFTVCLLYYLYFQILNQSQIYCNLRRKVLNSTWILRLIIFYQKIIPALAQIVGQMCRTNFGQDSVTNFSKGFNQILNKYFYQHFESNKYFSNFFITIWKDILSYFFPKIYLKIFFTKFGLISVDQVFH